MKTILRLLLLNICLFSSLTAHSYHTLNKSISQLPPITATTSGSFLNDADKEHLQTLFDTIRTSPTLSVYDRYRLMQQLRPRVPHDSQLHRTINIVANRSYKQLGMLRKAQIGIGNHPKKSIVGLLALLFLAYGFYPRKKNKSPDEPRPAAPTPVPAPLSVTIPTSDEAYALSGPSSPRSQALQAAEIQRHSGQRRGADAHLAAATARQWHEEDMEALREKTADQSWICNSCTMKNPFANKKCGICQAAPPDNITFPEVTPYPPAPTVSDTPVDPPPPEYRPTIRYFDQTAVKNEYQNLIPFMRGEQSATAAPTVSIGANCVDVPYDGWCGWHSAAKANQLLRGVRPTADTFEDDAPLLHRAVRATWAPDPNHPVNKSRGRWMTIDTNGEDMYNLSRATGQPIVVFHENSDGTITPHSRTVHRSIQNSGDIMPLALIHTGAHFKMFDYLK